MLKACLRHERRKKGTQKQGLGRSKGGFTTKIHLRVNATGLPIAAVITGGEVWDFKGYAPIMADGPEPKVLVADKGYDGDFIRDDMEKRGGVAVIPPSATVKSTSLSMGISTP